MARSLLLGFLSLLLVFRITDWHGLIRGSREAVDAENKAERSGASP